MNGSTPLLRKPPSTMFFRLLLLSSLIIASTVDALSSKLSHRLASTNSVAHYPTLSSPSTTTNKPTSTSALLAAPDDNDSVKLASSDQLVLGVTGTIASLIMIYSEYTLKTTGCGLPAGPFGLVGLIEGLSYLGVTGIVAYSVVTKVRTGSGLPAGPFGLVGAAEGLSFLAILAGVIVLVLQVTNYGYIPNAVPMEGGMCS